MSSFSPTSIPLRLAIARHLIQLWPFSRGRGRMASILLPICGRWPEHATASFSFRFGRFVNAPLASWPRGYRDLFLYGLLEQNEVAVWYRVLKEGSVVVDGGANWGYWSLVGSTIVGRSGQVCAFEPVPSTYESLQSNLRSSRAMNVTSHQAALAERGGTIRINLAANDPIGGQSSIGTPDDRQAEKVIECKTVSLDEVLRDTAVTLIKLDIEGGEFAALKGSTNILQRADKPVITFEWNRVTSAALQYQPEAILDLLSKCGYTFHLATTNGLIPFHERTDYPQWFPMVWALTEAHRNKLGI